MSDRRAGPSDRRTSDRGGGRRQDDRPSDWLSITRYARTYGIDRVTVYKWLRQELLFVYRVGPLLRIRNLPPDQHEALRRGASKV